MIIFVVAKVWSTQTFSLNFIGKKCQVCQKVNIFRNPKGKNYNCLLILHDNCSPKISKKGMNPNSPNFGITRTSNILNFVQGLD